MKIELNQWINHEKEMAEIMERHEIEWEQKGTCEEHLWMCIILRRRNAKK